MLTMSKVLSYEVSVCAATLQRYGDICGSCTSKFAHVQYVPIFRTSSTACSASLLMLYDLWGTREKIVRELTSVETEFFSFLFVRQYHALHHWVS